MQEPSKTNQELIEENSLLKQRIQELEKSEVERKRLELLLKKAEQEFSVIFDSTPSLIWQKDLKGIYQQVNKAYCDTVGLSKDDILGKTDYDLFPTEIADKYASHDRNVLKSGISELGIEEYHKKPSGGYGWSSTDKFIYSDANGNPTGTIGFATNITKHKRTKEELWESEEKFKAIANYTVDWDSWFSLDGKYLWVNPAVENITGYSPEEVMAMTDFISVLIVKEYRDQFIERFQYALRGNRGENFEFQYLHKNGSKRWLSASWQPIYDAKGKPLGIRASGRDITDRKLAEVALQEKNERLSMSLEIGNAGIWEWYLKTDEIRLDDRFHAMLGYKPGELPNTRQEWLPYHHPEDMTAWMPKAEAYLRGDNPVYESEHRIRNKTGTWSWVFTRGKLVNLTSTESPEQFVGIAMDITERKIVEARYKSIFENATEGIYQTTLDGRYLSVNPSFARMFGYDSPEEMIKSVTDIGRQLYVNPEDRERLKKLLVEQDRVQNFTAQLYRKDGSKFWVSINVHTVKDAEDCILYLEGTNEDITDHKHAEEALISSEQRLADIIEFLPDATLVIDRDGKVLAWNQAIEIMTGVKAKDMLGKGDHEYALPFYGERRPILIDLALHPES
ncbi:MAG: PAS domain S-box protein, partial [Syntrophus sp. (in: bacteria)]